MFEKRLVPLILLLFLSASLSCDGGSDGGLSLQPVVEGVVEGVVSVEDSTLQGVSVRLNGKASSTAYTNATGAFRFAGLTSGQYSVQIAGYPDDVEFDSTLKPANISAARVSEKVNFKGSKRREATVRGTVTVGGVGLEGVAVSLTGPEDRSATTDLTGNYAFTQLPQGRFTVAISGFDPSLYSFPTTEETVNAKNGKEVEVHFAGSPVPQIPEAPTGLSVEATGPTSAALSWTDESDDELGFEVDRRTGPEGSWEAIATAAEDATRYEDSGLEPNTSYVYRVRACGEAGCSDYTDEIAATTPDIPPKAPAGLTATPTGSSTVRLDWTDAADNETGFEIERREGPQGSWSQIASVEANVSTFGDGGLTANTTYSYRVRACNVEGCSSYSNEANATTSDLPPATPSNLAATATSSWTIDLSWVDESDNEVEFQLERKEGVGGSWSLLGSVGADVSVFGDSGLTPSTGYLYRVRACNPAGCSGYSNEAGATTADVPPQAPLALAATATGTTTVNVTWTDASDNETQFRVERKEGTGGVWGQVGVTGANAAVFGDAGLTPNTTYFYRARACNDAGCSAYSNESGATTQGSSGPNLFISDLYITQATQTPIGSVPLVQGKAGYLRVFAEASAPNSLQPSIRVRFFHGATLVHTEEIPAPASSVPTSLNEGSLGSSWNWDVPASLIQPGLAVLADVDPTNQVPEADESDNTFPAGGSPGAVDVRTASAFDVTFIPVRQNVNGLTGNVTGGNAGQFLDVTFRVWPIASADVALHAEYATDAEVLESNNGNGAWGTILGEIAALRVAEGSSRSYYGVVEVSYTSGIAGMGYLGWPAAIGWDRLPSGSGIAAHEWGHNWDLHHAPGCGAGNPDPAYPYADGKIGVWGLDVVSEALKSPSTYYDIMSYCGPEWVSDYMYQKVMDYRQAFPGYGGSAQAPEPSLLVWGRMEGGEIVLEPAFEVVTTPVLPAGSGNYRLEALGSGGESLFSLSFDPLPVPDGREGEGHFAFAVPLRSFSLPQLAELRLTGGGRAPTSLRTSAGPQRVAPPEPRVRPVGGSAVELTWDGAAFPMALVMDPSTGEILSFARGGQVTVSAPSNEVELAFSDGVRSSARIRRAVR